MTTTQIPLNILADLCENVPGFAERVTVRKVYRGENIARQSTARKGLVIPFAQILAGPSARDLGDAAPAIPKAPAARTASSAAPLAVTFRNHGTHGCDPDPHHGPEQLFQRGHPHHLGPCGQHAEATGQLPARFHPDAGELPPNGGTHRGSRGHRHSGP